MVEETPEVVEAAQPVCKVDSALLFQSTPVTDLYLKDEPSVEADAPADEPKDPEPEPEPAESEAIVEDVKEVCHLIPSTSQDSLY